MTKLGLSGCESIQCAFSVCADLCSAHWGDFKLRRLGFLLTLVKDTTASKNDSFTGNDVSAICYHIRLTDDSQLRDIFRVHPDTFCNTHDLLQCACDGLGSEAIIKESDTGEVGAHHPVMSFVAASQVKPEVNLSPVATRQRTCFETGFINLLTSSYH